MFLFPLPRGILKKQKKKQQQRREIPLPIDYLSDSLIDLSGEVT